MLMTRLLMCVPWVLLYAGAGHAQNHSLAEIFSKPISIERGAEASSIQLEMLGGKLYIDSSVNGVNRSFIFDTGSPTILSKALADELELTIVGQNTGLDANGAPVTMEVAIVNDMTLGDVTFRDVPVMVMDFSDVPLGTCFFDGGVLGSELLPGSAWRFNLEDSKLEIASSAALLDLAPTAARLPLMRSGYPYPPIVPYGIGRFSDNALFDTGSSNLLSLFREIADDRNVASNIKRRSNQSGRGTEGVSAGGMGEVVELRRFELSGLELGGHSLQNVRTQTKQVPPTLIGTGLFRSHKVTLDYVDGQMILEPVEGIAAPELADFSLMVTDGQPTVVRLFEKTDAAKAGLKLGDRVLEIDGQVLASENAEQQCETALWLAQQFDPASATELTIERDGQTQVIKLH